MLVVAIAIFLIICGIILAISLGRAASDADDAMDQMRIENWWNSDDD